MNNDTLDLEIKIAYLEDYTSQMNKVLIEQSKKIDKLIELNRQMREKLSYLEENISETSEDTPPPHY